LNQGVPFTDKRWNVDAVLNSPKKGQAYPDVFLTSTFGDEPLVGPTGTNAPTGTNIVTGAQDKAVAPTGGTKESPPKIESPKPPPPKPPSTTKEPSLVEQAGDFLYDLIPSFGGESKKDIFWTGENVPEQFRTNMSKTDFPVTIISGWEAGVYTTEQRDYALSTYNKMFGTSATTGAKLDEAWGWKDYLGIIGLGSGLVGGIAQLFGVMETRDAAEEALEQEKKVQADAKKLAEDRLALDRWIAEQNIAMQGQALEQSKPAYEPDLTPPRVIGY